MREHKEEASRPYVANRTPKENDVIAIHTNDELFFVGKVIKITPTQISVHWWSAKNINGTWAPQFLAKKGKGTAGPYIGRIWKESVIDVLRGFAGKRGKIDKQQLKAIIKIANEYKKEIVMEEKKRISPPSGLTHKKKYFSQ
jgi:hypothetical protein